jgi:hypothetical protein
MAGFYLAMGALLALAVGFAFAWTPLRILRWERAVVKAPGSSAWDLGNEKYQAACLLVDLGPAALPAVRRLVGNPDAEVRLAAVSALREPEHAWGLPLIVEAASDKDWRVAYVAIGSAEKVSGRRFGNVASPLTEPPTDETLRVFRRLLLDWWEREGRVKYGGGGE